MASTGILFSEADRDGIKQHEQKMLTDVKEGIQRQGYITKHAGRVLCVAFHPTDTGLVASCGLDGKIKLINRETGTLRREFLGHEGEVCSIAFNSDGSKLVSGGADTTVRIWAVATGKEAVGPLTGHSQSVFSVAFSHDGVKLCSGCGDTMILLWDVQKGEPSCVVTVWDDKGFSNDAELLKQLSTAGASRTARTGQFVVSAQDCCVSVTGENGGDVLCCFTAPVHVYALVWRAPHVYIGLVDKRVLTLEAPLLVMCM